MCTGCCLINVEEMCFRYPACLSISTVLGRRTLLKVDKLDISERGSSHNDTYNISNGCMCLNKASFLFEFIFEIVL